MKKLKSRIASICLALCLAALMDGCAGVEKKEEKTEGGGKGRERKRGVNVSRERTREIPE